MSLSSGYHWQVTLSKLSVGNTSIPLTVSKDAILDSGTSLTYIPGSEFTSVISQIKQGRNCWKYSDYDFCSCTSSTDSSFPTFSMTLGG